MLFYSLKAIADLLGAEPVVIWDALHATKVKMTFAGRDAARPTFGLWSEVRDAPNPDYKRPTDPLITTELIEYAGLKPAPSHITILADHLPATWQSRLREARMAQMRAGQGTPEYQRDEADVEAAVKRLDDAKVNLAMMTEALANAPKTGDVEKIRNAQAAVNEAQQDVERAQAAIERRRGDDPLMEEAAFVDGFDSVTLGHGLEADHWVTLPVVQAKHAAMLMAGINPTHYPDPDQRAPAHADLPRYRMALGTFESHGHDGIKRSLRDWVALAQSHGLQIDERVLVAVASVPDLPGDTAVEPAAGLQAPPKKHVYRQREQAELILREIVAVGLNPLELPANRPGKPGTRKQIRERLEGRHQLFPRGTTIFKKAWEDLQAQGEIATQKS